LAYDFRAWEHRYAHEFGVAFIVALLAGDATPQQIDIVGNWSAALGNHEERPLRGDPGVDVGEYVGMPINDAGRQKADSWMPTLHSLLEWQGRPHPVAYAMRAPQPNFRLATIIDPRTQQIAAYTITNLFESDVAEYRDMITIVRDRIQAMAEKGMTLAQVTAAAPAKDYDPLYSTPEWTTDMFVETVYADLGKRQKTGN
jgi:hypothetical protein